MFARINENSQVLEWPIMGLQELFPNTSFPSDPKDTDLPQGYVRVYNTLNPTPGVEEKLVSIGPVKEGDTWVHKYITVPLTIQELESKTAEHEAIMSANRGSAYQQESDPLFFKWQRGEIEKQVWLDKVAEIKQRYQ